MSGNFPENKEFYRAGALGQIHYNVSKTRQDFIVSL